MTKVEVADSEKSKQFMNSKKPNMFEAPYRRYVENILFATPTKFRMKDPKVYLY